MKMILIVEDHPTNLELLTQLLEPHYALVTASDGATGVELAKRHLPDLVIMDLGLPDMDGSRAIRTLRRDRRIARTPVLVLSAHTQVSSVSRAVTAGATEYLTKPVDGDQLLTAVARLLSMSPWTRH